MMLRLMVLGAEPENDEGVDALAAGWTYDPAGDIWKAMYSWKGPAIDRHSPWVWTGDRLFVWRSAVAPPNGSIDPVAYDPGFIGATAIAEPPIAARTDAASVWTGTEWLVWGGSDGSRELADGAAYSPTTDTWRVLAEAPLSARRVQGVWTGTEMVLLAGWSGGSTGVVTAHSGGAAYNPVTDTWRTLAFDVAHPGFESVWTGEAVLSFAKGGVIAFDPATETALDLCCSGMAGGTPIWIGDQVVTIGSFDTRAGGATFTLPDDWASPI